MAMVLEFHLLLAQSIHILLLIAIFCDTLLPLKICCTCFSGTLLSIQDLPVLRQTLLLLLNKLLLPLLRDPCLSLILI